MSKKVNTFCKQLQCHLDEIHDTVSNAMSCMETMHKKDVSCSTLHQKVQDALQKFEAGKQKAEEAKCQLQAMTCEDILQFLDQVEDCKKEHNVDQLCKHADQAETCAQAALSCAVAAIEEADLAIFAAIQTRMAAEEAAEPAPTA